uniref:Serine/threonine-protein phosphatase 7 long form homolog n=1 Tax=Nicotiana tabacum TaxID=4097 RepID=A0A1S4D102_TOBAC|nr:PREDICTED: serine/threonine-protein phosphatase 7 long form homolog [Nicotiana tabacum]
MDVPHVHLGPISDEILVLQGDHRSAYVWEGELVEQTLGTRRVDDVWDFIRERGLHSRIVQRLRDTGFYKIFEIGRLQLDWSQITALIDRPQGEAAASEGSRISMTAIRQHLDVLYPDIIGETEDLHIHRYTRLALLLLFGGVLFPNTSGNLVSMRFLHHLQQLDELPQYSWGTAFLAYLYRSMWRASMDTQSDVCDFLPLLQPPLPPLPPDVSPPLLPLARRWVLRCGNYRAIDAHHNLPLVRDALDMLEAAQFIWTPYNDELIAVLPDYCSIY